MASLLTPLQKGASPVVFNSVEGTRRSLFPLFLGRAPPPTVSKPTASSEGAAENSQGRKPLAMSCRPFGAGSADIAQLVPWELIMPLRGTSKP